MKKLSLEELQILGSMPVPPLTRHISEIADDLGTSTAVATQWCAHLESLGFLEYHSAGDYIATRSGQQRRHNTLRALRRAVKR